MARMIPARYAPVVIVMRHSLVRLSCRRGGDAGRDNAISRPIGASKERSHPASDDRSVDDTRL
jgi:hypothetical protein